MEVWLILLLFAFSLIFILPAVVLSKAKQAQQEIEKLNARLHAGGPSIRCSCNLIPPELRVAIGFIAGIALIIGGLTLRRKENVVTAQTLCATGILILYAVTFACRAFYHFSFFGLIPTFAIMTLITAAAFLLSVRMNAIAVALFGNCRGISHAGGAFERTG